MTGRLLHFVVPGDIDTKTGGYGYDRRIIAGLRSRGWSVELVSLPGDYPLATLNEQHRAAEMLASLPDGACVVVDGLAFGVLPASAEREQQRLQLVALVHHPLGLESGLDGLVSQLLLATEREALSFARGVIVTSPRTVTAIAELGVPASRIAVVEPGTEPAAAARGSDGGVPHLLCVASLTVRKGHDTLFDALERLLHLPWRLTCVGGFDRDSAYASWLGERLTSSPLVDRVTLAGELAGTRLDAAYDSADVFVLPTRYEGYGMVVAEALARAIPVVSTPTGAIAELVGDSAGVLVPADDPARLARELERLLTTPAAMAALRQGAGRVRATLPTWPEAAVRMEAALLRFTGR